MLRYLKCSRHIVRYFYCHGAAMPCAYWFNWESSMAPSDWEDEPYLPVATPQIKVWGWEPKTSEIHVSYRRGWERLKVRTAEHANRLWFAEVYMSRFRFRAPEASAPLDLRIGRPGWFGDYGDHGLDDTCQNEASRASQILEPVLDSSCFGLVRPGPGTRINSKNPPRRRQASKKEPQAL